MENYSDYLIKRKGQHYQIETLDGETLAIVDEDDGYVLLPQIDEERYILFGTPSGEGLGDIELLSVENDGVVIEVDAEGQRKEHFFDYFDESRHQFDNDLKDPFGNLTLEGEFEMFLRELSKQRDS